MVLVTHNIPFKQCFTAFEYLVKHGLGLSVADVALFAEDRSSPSIMEPAFKGCELGSNWASEYAANKVDKYLDGIAIWAIIC